jgi:hypothetical protein
LFEKEMLLVDLLDWKCEISGYLSVHHDALKVLKSGG